MLAVYWVRRSDISRSDHEMRSERCQNQGFYANTQPIIAHVANLLSCRIAANDNLKAL
jgi:hypothetical protein